MQLEGSGFLHRIFLYFGVTVVVVGFLSFIILYFLFKKVITANLYNYSIDYGYRYLTKNNTDYQEERVFSACLREIIARTLVVLLIHGALITVWIICISEKWSFWVVPEWSIQTGLLFGTVVSLCVQLHKTYSMVMRVGKLKEVDEEGIGWFDDVLGGDFSVDIGGCFWSIDDYPVIGDYYVVMDGYPKFLFLRPIVCAKREQQQ